MPLSKSVVFKSVLKKGNRFQVPKLVRSQQKLNTSEVLKVTVSVVGLMQAHETFLAPIHRDGRIVVPQLTIDLMRHEKPNLEGYAVEVTLQPP